VIAFAATTLLLANSRAAERPREDAPGGDPLVWTVGQWEGTRTETATGHADRLHSEIQSVLAGSGTEERIEVDEGSPHYHGLYLEVSDRSLHKSVIVYVNARRRRFSRLEGTANADGGEWTSVTAEPPHGSRMRIERTGKDSWRRTQLVSEDGGRTWTTLFVDEMRRQ
jgi:hypothetical protein